MSKKRWSKKETVKVNTDSGNQKIKRHMGTAALIISILSLVISLFGGIPGIIAWIQFSKNKPKLSFQLVHMLIGETDRNSTNRTSVFLSGTLTNKGEMVLSPSIFEARVFFDGKWKKLERALIPDGVEFLSNESTIDVGNPSTMDLQKYAQKISSMQPVEGHFLFFTDIPRNEFIEKSTSLEITCIDVANNEFVCTVDINKLGKGGIPIVYPKHGLQVKPK